MNLSTSPEKMELKGQEVFHSLKGKKIVVVGLARSGVGAANLLFSLGADVTVTDKKGSDQLTEFLNRLRHGINTVIGEHPFLLFEEADTIVVSPGVPLDIAPIRHAANKGVKIISELELAYQIVEARGNRREAIGNKAAHHPFFLAITGTNGKSTTTTLLYEMIKNSGFNAIVGGNIGNALTEEILNFNFQISNFDYIVAEVSSFQLESIDAFRPRGAAILNITPDHLDRYHSMSDYIDAKCRIFMNQTAEDFLILNADDPTTEEIIKRIKAQAASGKEVPQVVYFSRNEKVEGAYLKDGFIHFNLPEFNIPSTFTLQPSTFKIKGVHNIENAMAASLMALLSGSSIEAVVNTMNTFPGLEHRLEFVREIDGVKFINDSKGTNVGAVVKSLESFNEPLVLIAGGRDKDSDFTILRPLIREKVKALILIGEAKDKIKKAVGDVVKDVFIEDDFKAAIIKAKQVASSGDIVLLSPACASFDMFKDFEDRGRQFKEVVNSL